MSQDNQLDLDIQNYSINDIEKFFRFRPKQKYSKTDIELREVEIREKLLGSGHIDKKFKKDLIDFLTKAKHWLIYTKFPEEKAPSSIPATYQLDKLDYPNSKIEPTSRQDTLIKRPDTQFIYASNSEYFQGNVNPLNRRTLTKCLTIDTRFRNSLYITQSSDFTIQLPIKLTKVVSMKISAIELPTTFYGISSKYGNHFFFIEIGIFVEKKLITDHLKIVIPDGNYTACDLIEVINHELQCNTNCDANIFSLITFELDVINSGSGTSKVMVQPVCDNPKTKYIEYIKLDFTRDINGEYSNLNLCSKIGWNLGFLKGVYCDKTSYKAETIIQTTTINYVYLAIDDFNNNMNNHFLTTFTESILNPNIIARLSLKNTYMWQNDSYQIVAEPRKYFGPVDIQRLHIQLYDEWGRILDMNNSDYSFCITFELLYDF